jgi:hypothetical protein
MATLMLLKNSQAGLDSVQAVGAVTQIVEDAVVDAGVTPDTDLLSTYREVLSEDRTRKNVAKLAAPKM